MITLIICDTPAELDTLQARFPGLKMFATEQAAHVKKDWLSAEEFEAAMLEKGYKTSSLITKKKLCELHGVIAKKFGNHYKFSNELERIPNKK